MTVLKVVELHAYYGDSHVLQGVTLDVAKGTVTAVLGRNGVGKTTLCRSIIGLTPPREGSVLFDGVEIARLPPHRIFDAGISLVPQGRRIFPSLTVQENLAIAVRPPRSRPSGASAAPGWDLQKVFSVFPRLLERSGNRGNELSGGEQQMLAIARALVARPELLIMDEPTEGLAPMLVAEVAAVIGRLRDEGTSILLAEQNAAFAVKVADHVHVMSKGAVVHSSDPGALWDNEEIKTQLLGVPAPVGVPPTTIRSDSRT
ncbi:MAG: ABC transporter ATP-binding protein [Acidobacteria bacterium]|nr:ABC transporter ATP-binding protein [Acidobacteriota bacterium]